MTVLDDESLLLDRPLEGGNLGYRILKATQLKYDIPVDEVYTLAASHAHNLALSAQSGKELCDFYRYFQTSYFNEVKVSKELKGRMAVKEQELLAAITEKNDALAAESKADAALTKAVEDHSLVLFNKDEEIRLLREQIAEARELERATVKEYQKGMDFVSRLLNRYNGGWSAAMRCVRHTFPELDWSKIEEAHTNLVHGLPVEGEDLDPGVTEADIANADPRIEFEEEQEAANDVADTPNPDADPTVEETVVVVDGSEGEEQTK
ncbi:uncharacterized protein LOC130589374 [Beta vulgaris subsp. vulgaris]|uniref:uncharacterized protein LOC130589374 n=1 Tax=Beta vulgaris subsp. vulgaris TaxID=3555 RepID=UPI002549B136|nr:uncharacterized protein LOC130589374 [Beta vulgaris subsp. vulgaris]